MTYMAGIGSQYSSKILLSHCSPEQPYSIPLGADTQAHIRSLSFLPSHMPVLLMYSTKLHLLGQASLGFVAYITDVLEDLQSVLLYESV